MEPGSTIYRPSWGAGSRRADRLHLRSVTHADVAVCGVRIVPIDTPAQSSFAKCKVCANTNARVMERLSALVRAAPAQETPLLDGLEPPVAPAVAPTVAPTLPFVAPTSEEVAPTTADVAPTEVVVAPGTLDAAAPLTDEQRKTFLSGTPKGDGWVDAPQGSVPEGVVIHRDAEPFAAAAAKKGDGIELEL